ncbi:sulfite exporter TauE/SafE family protein [Blastococcus brunescens]|uniref:Probable membrane transporter protein n=1 Tax=Blastococcus brunescens TaxID=1564165 RepID=A0ABZ1B3H2_9ACTN|nr:sulfite exporter TauE/SafE family protein [Blastococcus sp. BMG 8361]WRL64328.1 sulfite exporter TauE/SafE family protein [Blastococcus sp. BMG 8361]
MDWWDPSIAVAGLLVGMVVGLTGMGGGALMTPILVFFFGVPPLTAVSSDVVASLFMKPIGGFVHLRRGTVHLGLVAWLCLGSVPGAFAGVLLLRWIGGTAACRSSCWWPSVPSSCSRPWRWRRRATSSSGSGNDAGPQVRGISRSGR